MPHAMPTHIKDYLQQHLPVSYKMWWMRCQVMDVQPVTSHPTTFITKDGRLEKVQLDPVHYLRFALRDVDAPDDDKMGYTVDVHPNPKYKDYRLNDRVSLFGHEPVGAEFLSHPRFFYHHENRTVYACFEPHYVDQNLVPRPDLKVNAEGGLRDKGIKAMSGFLKKIGSDPSKINAEELNKSLPGGINLEPIYVAVSNLINEYVLATEDANFPCFNPRHKNLRGGGQLIE